MPLKGACIELGFHWASLLLRLNHSQVACEKWFLECIGQAPDLRHVLRVVAGDIPRTTALLALKFDFIFFTGM